MLNQKKKNIGKFRIYLNFFLKKIYIYIYKCVLILREVIEEIKNDPPNVAPNGNIHQITVEVNKQQQK